MRSVTLTDGTPVPALGLGTWMMGDRPADRPAELDALRAGLDAGMTLVDTAEMYGDGRSEELVGEAIRGRREEVFLVSKVLPSNASREGVQQACDRSLRRLGTDRLDLYLLHWRGGVPLAETVAGFEALLAAGKIRRWGVSNFDVADLEELAGVTDLKACAANQVLYNPEHRGIEFDLIPWQAKHRIPVMAYSPIGQGGALLRSPALAAVARRHGATPAQVALAWALRHPHLFAIPKTGNAPRARENAAAVSFTLGAEDWAEIDAAYPPPRRKRDLAMI